MRPMVHFVHDGSTRRFSDAITELLLKEYDLVEDPARAQCAVLLLTPMPSASSFAQLIAILVRYPQIPLFLVFHDPFGDPSEQAAERNNQNVTRDKLQEATKRRFELYTFTAFLESLTENPYFLISKLKVPHIPDDLNIVFDPSLTPEQVEGTLTALANYFRACGGVGLSAEFAEQELVPEDVHA